MQRQLKPLLAMCLLGLMTAAAWPQNTQRISALLKEMPADMPLSIVIADPEGFDQNVLALNRRFNPGADATGIIADLKSEIAIGDWIDFSQPMGMAVPTLGPGGGEGLLWVRVPDFATKAGRVEGATQEDGVWKLTLSDAEPIFARATGDYVLIDTSGDLLAQFKPGERTLATVLKGRLDTFDRHGVLIRFDAEPVRPMLMGVVGQFQQMAPMMAMMAAQQPGADPAMQMGFIKTLADAAGRFVQQLSYLEIGFSLTKEDMDATVLAGFTEGPIRQYLADQKPATRDLLKGMEDQPFFMALAYHVPGLEASFFDYFYDQVAENAVAPGGMPGQAPAEGDADEKRKKLLDALAQSKKLYRMIEGQAMLVGTSPKGMTVTGHYVGADVDKLFSELKTATEAAQLISQQLSAGVTYEAVEPVKIGDTTVEMFKVNVDTSQPGAAQVRQLYGDDVRMALGIVGGAVRFAMGGEAHIRKVFRTGADEKPLRSNDLVRRAIARLPEKRNAIVLVDPAGMLPVFGPMLGTSVPESIPPGPPVAISISLSGEPVRVDVHVPMQAIDRVMQATAPEAPM